jgi:hypothetical protein
VDASTARGRSAGARPWLCVVAVVLVGTALGVASELAGELPGPWYTTAALGAPWIVAGFFTARLCRRVWTSALASVGVLAIGLAVVAGIRGSGYVQADPFLAVWGLLAVLFGGMVGVAAAAGCDDRLNVRAAGWALPVAVSIVEAAATLTRTDAAVAAGFDLALAAVVFAVGSRAVPRTRLGMATLILTLSLLMLGLLVRATVPSSTYVV